MQRILALFLWTAQNCSQGNLSSRNVVSFLNLSAPETYFWLDFFWGKTTFCLMDLSVSLPSRYYLLMWKCFQNCGIETKKRNPPEPFYVPKVHRGEVQSTCFFLFFQPSDVWKKSESESKKVVTCECGCDDNWGIGIPFCQHWMPSTWCQKPLRV